MHTIKKPNEHTHFTTSWALLHSLAIVFVLVNLATGLRIATLSTPWLLEWSALLPQGALHWIHIIGACGLSAITLAYGLHRYSHSPVPSTTRSAQYHQIISRIAYVLISLSLISGWLLFFDVALPVVDIHFYSALALLLYVFLHGGGYFIHYGWPSIRRAFVPTPTHVIAPKAMLVGAGIGLTLWVSVGYQPASRLSVKAIPLTSVITIDGHSEESEWDDAHTLLVLTRGGANFDNGETLVTLKALENGEEAFFSITWQDSTHSLEHLPLIKTAQGWQIKQQGFHQFDETAYYEDKFAVMLANQCRAGGAGTAQLGPAPLANHPANTHGKGYHYSDDGAIRDIWHWKAVRTNNMHLADDNFFGAPLPPRAGDRRYTAGYAADGKESGAYVMNWQWYRPDVVIPKRLPTHDALITPYQKNHPHSPAEPPLPWVISWFDYTPYQASRDHYPIGTIMPSVMYRSNRFEGDRAHVRAHGQWRDGQWTLELARPLDTGSAHDIVLGAGTCLWVAAFDHSQIAHTRHQQAIRLEFARQP